MMMMCGNTGHKGAGFCITFSPLFLKKDKEKGKKNQTLKRVVICLGFYNFIWEHVKKLSLFLSLFLSIERTKERKTHVSNRRRV